MTGDQARRERTISTMFRVEGASNFCFDPLRRIENTWGSGSNLCWSSRSNIFHAVSRCPRTQKLRISAVKESKLGRNPCSKSSLKSSSGSACPSGKGSPSFKVSSEVQMLAGGGALISKRGSVAREQIILAAKGLCVEDLAKRLAKCSKVLR